MKTTASIVAAAFLMVPSPAWADEPEIAKAEPQNGVFVTYGWHSIVLELKDGKFRYWFSSDAKGEDVAYPLEGSYTTSEDKIVLKHHRFIPLESNWTFRSIDGVVTLWRSDAMQLAASKERKLDLYLSGKGNFFRTGGGSILVPSKASAEEAWKSPQVATLSEEEYKALKQKQKAKADNSGEPTTAPEPKPESDRVPEVLPQ